MCMCVFSDNKKYLIFKIMIKWLVDCFIDFSVVIIDEELELWWIENDKIWKWTINIELRHRWADLERSLHTLNCYILLEPYRFIQIKNLQSVDKMSVLCVRVWRNTKPILSLHLPNIKEFLGYFTLYCHSRSHRQHV